MQVPLSIPFVVGVRMRVDVRMVVGVRMLVVSMTMRMRTVTVCMRVV
jgi:hypothetical protein